jgi:ribosomal protein S12
MTSFVKAAGLAGILVAVIATVTPELKADQPNSAVREGYAVTTELGGNVSAITYWVSESDGWHVVTTVDTVIERNGDAEKHAVVRFSSVLLPGQSQSISVPFAIGERQQVLRIRRLGNQIEVARVGGSA